jgi:hypothetical protein
LKVVDKGTEKRIGGAYAPTRPLFAMFAMAMFAGLVYLLWWSLQPPGLNTVRLRDGTRIALASVTYGTMHRFEPAPPLFRLARGLNLPWKVPDIATITTPGPEMRLWLYIRMSKTPESWDGFVVFEDQHGCPFDEGKSDSEVWGDENGLWSTMRPSASLENGQAFDLCAFDNALRQEVLRFHVEPNLVAKPLPVKQVLKPRPLPQTAASKGLRATLVSLKTVPTPDRPHYRAILRGVNSEGAAMSPLYLSVEDRYGRRIESLDDSERAELRGKGFPFRGFCRREPAWKLIAVMVAEPTTNDHPDAVWDFPLVSSSGAQSNSSQRALSLVVSESSSIGIPTATGRKMKLVELMVRGSRRSTRNRIAITRINGIDAAREVERLKHRFREGQKPVLTAELPPNGEWCVLKVPVPAGAKSYRVRIAEYVGHRFEFVVAPPGSSRSAASAAESGRTASAPIKARANLRETMRQTLSREMKIACLRS